MTITPFPTNTVDTIDAIRDEIGRQITINVKVQGTACPVCDLDPITNTSTDSFCETCSGVYWLNTTSGISTYAHIRWGGSDQPMYTAGGVIDMGDCIATIKYTETLLSGVQNSDHFIVDDKDMYLKKYILRGVKPLNRIRVILKEDSN